MTLTNKINVRVSKRERDLLVRMAAREEKTLSAYLRDVAVARARDVLWGEMNRRARLEEFSNANCSVCHYWPCKCPGTGP